MGSGNGLRSATGYTSSEQPTTPKPMPNATIAMTLPAENSGGKQELHLTVQDINGGRIEYFFTLTGQYEGSAIQIDFDVMGRAELIEMRTMIDLILEHNAQIHTSPQSKD